MTSYSAKCQANGVLISSSRGGINKSLLLPVECLSQLCKILPILHRTLKTSPRAIDMDLGDKLYRVTCTGKGKKPRIDIRQYFVNAYGNRHPTKQGLSVQLQEVPDLQEKLQSAEQGAKELDLEYQRMKQTVRKYFMEKYGETIKQECLACVTNEPSQESHFGGCMRFDMEGNALVADPNVVMNLFVQTDPSTVAQELKLTPDQVDQIYVDFWAHPEELL